MIYKKGIKMKEEEKFEQYKLFIESAEKTVIKE